MLEGYRNHLQIFLDWHPDLIVGVHVPSVGGTNVGLESMHSESMVIFHLTKEWIDCFRRFKVRSCNGW